MILSQITLVRQSTIPTGICQDISNYLNQHFTEELSLSQLAAALGYNKYHISHIFKITLAVPTMITLNTCAQNMRWGY